MPTRPRGHRTVPHTADVIVEAWAPDLASCLEEAAAALVGICADTGRAAEVERRPVRLAPAPPEALLLDLLEEVIFALDTAGAVPARAEVTSTPDGGLDVVLVLVDPAAVRATGSVPKAVSRSGLEVRVEPRRVDGRFLVDV